MASETVADVEMSELPQAPATTTQDEVKDCKDSTLDAKSEDAQKAKKEGDVNSDSSPRKQYSEEEKLKRKAYFKQIKEKRRLARERYVRNQKLRGPLGRKPLPKTQSSILKASHMSEQDQKMLEFYKTRLLSLRTENEELHKRLAFLVSENMRFLEVSWFFK